MFIIDIFKATTDLFFEMSPYLILGLFFVALLNFFFNKEMILKYVGANNIWSVIIAAMFGVPLPLCSCGVIPTSVFMAKNGASNGAVVAFLISTPQTGIDSIIATYGMLGPIFAIFRPIAALFMGIFGGLIVRYLPEDKKKIDTTKIIETEEINLNKDNTKKFTYSKAKQSLKYAYFEFLDDISSQFIVGLFIAGLITFLIPEDFFAGSGLIRGIPGMLILAAIGIPMYVCATASIPIAISLMLKGFSPGAAFVFLSSGPSTNAASLSIIIKVLGKKIAFIFVGVITVFSIFFGLLLDKIFEFANISPVDSFKHIHSHNMNENDEFMLIISIIFFILILLSLYRKFIKDRLINKELKMENQIATKIKVEGMTCNHCVMNVQRAVSGSNGVTKVNVNLSENAAYVEGDFILAEVVNAIEGVGYKVVN